jgi:hypothetical protein
LSRKRPKAKPDDNEWTKIWLVCYRSSRWITNGLSLILNGCHFYYFYCRLWVTQTILFFHESNFTVLPPN